MTSGLPQTHVSISGNILKFKYPVSVCITMYRHQPTQLNPTILVGGIPTPLKNRKSVGMILPNIWGKKVPKPPISYYWGWFTGLSHLYMGELTPVTGPTESIRGMIPWASRPVTAKLEPAVIGDLQSSPWS